MISNGDKTNVQLYSRNNDNIHKKTMKFDNNKTNLAKLLKDDPVFENIDKRLYKDFLKPNKNKKTKTKTKKQKQKQKQKNKKTKTKTKKQKNKKTKKQK